MSEEEKTYYQILCVSQNATLKEIKKSYRDLSKKYHPDVNRDWDTTEIFAELQQAYEILSNPQERSWYDEHLENPDPFLVFSKVIQEFQKRNCASVENFFFTYFSEVFDNLIAEEKKLTSRKMDNAPRFGDLMTSVKDVSKFYRFWDTFYTGRNFSWMDKYSLSMASNRRERKAIVEENSKWRKKEKEKYVRSFKKFVQFVRKKDVRYKKVVEMQVKREKKLKEESEKERLRKEIEEVEMEMRNKLIEERLQGVEAQIDVNLQNDQNDLSSFFENQEKKKKKKGSTEGEVVKKPKLTERKKKKKKKGRKKKKKGKDSSISKQENENEDEEEKKQKQDVDAEDEEEAREEKKTEKEKEKKEEEEEEEDPLMARFRLDSGEDEEDDVRFMSKAERKKLKKKRRKGKKEKNSNQQNQNQNQNQNPQQAQNRGGGRGKRKKRNRKKKKMEKEKEKQEEEKKSKSYVCTVCEIEFSSKSKLFRHLDREKHHKTKEM